MSTLVSTAALTIARNKAGQHVYLYKNQPVDAGALDPDDANRLLGEGFLAKQGSDADVSSDPVAGKVADILAEVGDDKAKAQAALDAEQVKGDDARSSLVEKLQAVIAKQD